MPSNFDLLTIDVEGHDLAVLTSNDWSVWKPRVLVVEEHGPACAGRAQAFVEGLGYQLASICNVSKIFIFKR